METVYPKVTSLVMPRPSLKKWLQKSLIIPILMTLLILCLLWDNKYEEMNFQQIEEVSFEPKEPLKEEEIDFISKTAKEMNVKPLLVTLVNNAYLPFLYSWLCNTKQLGIHHQVLIISTDQTVKDMIKELWPEINVVSISLNSADGAQIFSHVGYVKLMIRRTQILLKLLQHGIETFLFEADCLWIGNPTLYSTKLIGYDIIIGEITGTQEVTGGLMHLFANSATIEMFKQLTKMLINLEYKIQFKPPGEAISVLENDQMYLSYLVRKSYGGLKSKIIPPVHFADGKWYCLPMEERVKSKPIIINNNWVLGNDKKISRAKSWGHWFIKDDNSCDLTRVNSVLNEWEFNVYGPRNFTCSANSLENDVTHHLLCFLFCLYFTVI